MQQGAGTLQLGLSRCTRHQAVLLTIDQILKQESKLRAQAGDARKVTQF